MLLIGSYTLMGETTETHLVEWMSRDPAFGASWEQRGAAPLGSIWETRQPPLVQML